MLTDEQRAAWERDGYLAIRGYFSHAEVGRVTELVEAIFRDPPGYLVVDDTSTGRRSRLADLPPAGRSPRTFKLNDLYLEHPEVRGVALAERVRPLLAGLLGEAGVLCNTLNFEKGSGQPEHIDSLFMTPRTPGRLVATWVALEDAHPDAGQLFYYPGSHKLPLYAFADGTNHAADAEMPRWHEYIRRQLETAGFPREQFAARKGDLFFWHANLVHGGSPIADPSRTRKSLVSHYFGLSDCRALGVECVPAGDAYWVRRGHPPLPGALTARQRVARLLRRLGLYDFAKRLVGRRAA